MSRRPLRWYMVKDYIENVGWVIVIACMLVIFVALAAGFVGGAIHIWRDLL